MFLKNKKPTMTKKQLFIASLLAMASLGTQAQSGDTPRVTTNKRYARGATMAFARATFVGTNITERGLCYSTSPNPTIDDSCSTSYYSYDDNGVIYTIDSLQPATKYYMRPYAKNKSGLVGYGEVIKFYTIPKGKLTYSVRSGGDADAVTRITAAVKEAVDLWNNLTSIQGVNFNVGHNSGTPTADCSYGGYIRVGSNTSYQRTGTLLHEMLHGVGVGTHSIWYNSELRKNTSSGYWLGDRVTEVVRFLENNDTEQLNGDKTHMWPYGINGAFEDSQAKGLYYGCSLICEALGEDGLPPSGGFATPAYSFEQEDTIKYYLKNEDADHGLSSSYLVNNADGSLAWKAVSDVTANDSAAWYISFVPSASLYVLRNAATGRYLTYGSNGFTTKETDKPLVSERMHIMRGRVDVFEGKDYRGYYIIKNNSTLTPPTMTAANNGNVTSASYNLSNSATIQRWLILTAEETKDVETANSSKYKTEIESLLAKAKELLNHPHEEETQGADSIFAAEISRIDSTASAAEDDATLEALVSDITTDTYNFLSAVSPSDMNNPYDLTYNIVNPELDDDEGWSEEATVNYSCAEFFGTGFNFYQTLSNMPKGYYLLKVQAFQRAGTVEDSYANHTAGKETIGTSFYINGVSKKVASIWDQTLTEKLGTGSESEQGGNYVPNDMESAAAYFGNGMYDNVLRTRVRTTGDMTVGIKNTTQSGSEWTAFDNFRLLYFGKNMPDTDGIVSVTSGASKDSKVIYDLQGRRINVTNMGDLKSGIYIINNKKVVVR